MAITHLASTRDLSDEALLAILRDARLFVSELGHRHDRTETLAGRNIALAFFEPSTRTRLSFETAAHRLGASTVVFLPHGSSVEKGETLLETMATIEAMRFDVIVVRHSANGIIDQVIANSHVSIINAGEGTTSHPTQALLDMATLVEHYGDLSGKRVCIIGDVRHSRVARSQIDLGRRLGMEFAICSPLELQPDHQDPFFSECAQFSSIDEAAAWADVMSLLRIQRERITDVILPELADYRAFYSMTSERARRMTDKVIIHPGPVNLGVEIDAEVLDMKHCLIHRQVTHGVAVRMAVLKHVLLSRHAT